MSRTGHLNLVELTLPPSTEWSFDATGWCFVRVKDGVGYALLGSSAQSLSPGDVFIACAAGEWILRASQLGDLNLQYFRLNPELLGGFFTLAEEHYLETAAVQNQRAPRHFPAGHVVGKEFTRLCAQAAPENRLTCRCQMLSIAALALENELARRPLETHKSPAARDRFSQLMAELPAAEIQHLSISELARRCGCSERHFSRLFRNYFGFSIRAKQMELRLQKAQQLLRESDTKVINVALESGFRHLGLFNAMFKKRFGMTPTEWRQQDSRKRAARRIVRLS
jgi:AraC-like DNA-binding protein